jgi:serine/threonine-protein kinase
VAGLLAASMDPLGVAVAGARGIPVPSVLVVLWTYFPNYLAAVLAVLPSQIISKLGRELSKARELGSYRLGEILARGGMGEVYRAHHRLLARPAAIKLINPEALGGQSRQMNLQRFWHEAEVAASLTSPHTIALYDFGVTGNGSLYYVMELLNGLGLDSLVERFGPIPAGRVAYLLRQVCHSLAEAHAVGFIHRDIKPANIFVCRIGLEADFVKVLDFGLVKSSRAAAREESLRTAPDVVVGTPAFMAPELAVGERSIDARADIYALGCVAYWLLTGRLVFEAESAMKMMLEHVGTEPVPPSRVTELPVPPSLEELVLACLAKDRDKRPSDARQLARRLAVCDVGEPWTPEQAARWWGIHLPEIRPAAAALASWAERERWSEFETVAGTAELKSDLLT